MHSESHVDLFLARCMHVCLIKSYRKFPFVNFFLTMKLILPLFLVYGWLQWGNAAKMLVLEEVASKLYQKGSEVAGSFFKTAGTPVVDYVHPSLRTESDPVLHERATAHFAIYTDPDCLQLDSILDLKINRCASFYTGNLKPTLMEETGSSWLLSLQDYDASCESTIGSPVVQTFEKNVCQESALGIGFVKFNLIGHPKKSIPGGGGAWVFYDNDDDCEISKHTNLARAQMMITWPIGGCTDGFFSFVKPISCDATEFTLDLYNDALCPAGMSWGTAQYSTNPAILGCPHNSIFLTPFQVRCIAPEI
jgi:hypothetical protein